MNIENMKKAALVIAGIAVGAAAGTATLSFADGNPATATVTSGNLIMPYDGFLMLDSTGVTGTQKLKFELYEAANGGAPVWTETQDVNVYNGRFSVGLGSITSLTQTILDAEKVWLAITIVDTSGAMPVEVPLSGRQAIEPAPYAAWSANSADFNVAGTLNVEGVSNLKATNATVGSLSGAGTGAVVRVINSNSASGQELAIDGDELNAATDLNINLRSKRKTIIHGALDAEATARVKQTLRVDGATTLAGGINGATNVNGDLLLNSRKLRMGSNGIDYELTGVDSTYNQHGVELRALSNPASGEPLFRVLSSGGAERLRVEHDGQVRMENNLRVEGDLTVTGGISRTVNCPSGWVRSTNGLEVLCIRRVVESGGTLWGSAAGSCSTAYGAHLCSMAEYRSAWSSGITRSNGYWLADRLGDDRAVCTSSTTDRDNFDNDCNANSSSGISGYYCCAVLSTR